MVTRVVLDANVFVGGLISSIGAPAAILAAWQDEQFQVVISSAILNELARVLHYPKLQNRYRLAQPKIERLLHLLQRQALEVNPTEEVAAIEVDPDDNRYLECAVAAEAEFIVSGDRHLWSLGSYQGIQILAPAGFLAVLQMEGQSP